MPVKSSTTKKRTAAKITASATASAKRGASKSTTKELATNTPEIAHTKESVFDLVSMLVHDLESPLASMNYTLELMESGRFDDSNPLHKRMVEGAHVAVQRAETIVADMLAAAKSEETNLTVNWQEVNLFTVAEKAVDMASPAASQSNVTVSLDPSSESCNQALTQADEHLVVRIADNMIFNAIRHTPGNGTIVVSIECDDENVSMTVTDSGDGIKGIDPQKLFEKFGQAEYRKDKMHRGVGLGLFFCRIAAEAMGAKLFARNAETGGAQFGITFPIPNAKPVN